MSDLIPLSKAAKYSSNRINSADLILENFVTIDNLLPNKEGVTTAESLPPSGNTFPAYKKGNILVGNIRPYLKKIWYANRDGGNSADVLVFDVKKGYDAKFVYYALFRDDFFNHMMTGAKGTRMPRGDKNRILEFLIPGFHIVNQQKIAAVLSALDAKIELNRRLNAELETLAKTIYDYWFVQFDFSNELGLPYKSSGGEMVWNAQLKRKIPAGWEVAKLGKYVTSKRGVSYSSKNLADSGTPMVNLNSFNVDGTYKTEGIKYFVGDYSESKILKPFDLIMCNTQQTALDPTKDIIGRSLLIPDIFESDIVSSHHVTTITVKKKNLKYYLNSLFNSEYFHRYISGYATGTNILGLNFDGVLWHQTPIPIDDLLEKFAAITINVEKKKANIIKENQTLTELRDWLLPMLMNGQVTVN